MCKKSEILALSMFAILSLFFFRSLKKTSFVLGGLNPSAICDVSFIEFTGSDWIASLRVCRPGAHIVRWFLPHGQAHALGLWPCHLVGLVSAEVALLDVGRSCTRLTGDQVLASTSLVMFKPLFRPSVKRLLQFLSGQSSDGTRKFPNVTCWWWGLTIWAWP